MRSALFSAALQRGFPRLRPPHSFMFFLLATVFTLFDRGMVLLHVVFISLAGRERVHHSSSSLQCCCLWKYSVLLPLFPPTPRIYTGLDSWGQWGGREQGSGKQLLIGNLYVQIGIFSVQAPHLLVSRD